MTGLKGWCTRLVWRSNAAVSETEISANEDRIVYGDFGTQRI